MSAGEVSIRPLDPERDAAGVVELIREVFPYTVTTVESWRQQYASIPERARNAAWIAAADGLIAGRAEAHLNWFSESGTAVGGVSVRNGFRRRGIGTRLWELVDDHVHELAPTRMLTSFVETDDGVAFAQARGFVEARAETLSCVDPRIVDTSALDAIAPSIRIVPLRDVPVEEIYEVDVMTTPDVPMTDELTDIRFDDWLNAIWRRPTITQDGSFAAVVDDRVVCITMLGANLEVGRGFNEYTGTLSTYRRSGLAFLVKLASLRWAAANGIEAVWTTNDETNAAMLSVNQRLGYRRSVRRVEYVRGG
jgi:GNAT superfamily N-acetyltransferase